MSDSDVREPFGSLLRRHRLAIGLTQEQLAERSGVAKRTIQDLEGGVARPRRETVRRLIGALKLPPEAHAVFEAVRPSRRPRVAHVTPHAWAVEGFTKLLAHGGGVTDVGTELMVLTATAAVLFAIAGWLLRRRLTR